jgi:hypothetical protein
LKESRLLADEYIRLKGKDSPKGFEDYINKYYPSKRLLFLVRLVEQKDYLTYEILN